MEIINSEDYIARLLAAPRPGAENILAFHDYRVGGICKDSRLMLAPLDDHLCHRGDGVFESIVYRNKRIFQFESHLKRMQKSAAGLKLSPPCPWEEIRDIILAVVKAGGADSGSIRVLLGRGPGGFGISPAECPKPSLYVIAWKETPKPDWWYERGLSSFHSSIPARQSYMAQIKNANYLPNVLMIEEAITKGLDLPLSFDDQNCLAETAIANVALVDAAGTLVVPEFTNSLPGTTVLKAMEIAEKSNIRVERRRVPENEIYDAGELLVLGTVYECVGITSYEGRSIGSGKPGPVSTILREGLREALLAGGTPF